MNGEVSASGGGGAEIGIMRLYDDLLCTSDAFLRCYILVYILLSILKRSRILRHPLTLQSSRLPCDEHEILYL